MKLKNISYAVLITIALVGCGGGGSSSPSNGGNTGGNTPGTGTSSSLQSSCSGTYCGNVDNSTFGAGVGIWHAVNNGDTEKVINVDLTLNSAAKLYGVYTNINSSDIAFPSGVTRDIKQELNIPVEKSAEEIRHEKNREVLKLLKTGLAQRSLAQVLNTQLNSVVGDQNTFTHEENGNTVSTAATLAYQGTASDGRTINYWVQSSEYVPTKITISHIAQLHNIFAVGANSGYNTVVSIAGQPWGPTPFNNLIGPNQDLNVFISNLTPDNKPFGLMGYFWTGDTVLKTSNAQSNQSLMVHLDSETMYKSNVGVQEVSSTLVHEFTHLVNFYQRDLVKYDSVNNKYFGFDVAMEETSAMMMEDIAANKTGAFPEDRMLGWLYSKQLNCSLDEFTDSNGCDSYSLHGSFGSYMLRKYGITGYQQMLKDIGTTSLSSQFDKMIRSQTNYSKTLADELRTFNNTYVLMQKSAVPSEFSYSGKNDSGYSLKNLQQEAANYYNQYTDGTSGSVPSSLKSLGGSYSISYGQNSGKFTRQITIPPHSSYSIIAVQ